MKKKEDPWEAFVIKDEDLVCKLGDTLKLIHDIDCSDWDTDDMTHYVASGQLYKTIDRKGAGWDLVKLSGDGPPTLRVMNNDVLESFEIIKKSD